jgi:murein DD-endopeptidase MepM/ murein hydrolase activator NlpD
LHFSYRLHALPYIGGTISSGQWVNPAPYLNSGQLGKPIAGYPAKISQNFGEEAIAGLYGPDGHPGIDIADAKGSPIYAAQSGIATRWSDSGCVLGGVQTDRGEGIIITGDDGTQTLYWHIQR